MTPPFAGLHFGPITISLYGFMIATAVLVGYWLARRRAHWYSVDPTVLDELLAPLVLGAIIGARLYHVIDKWTYYSHHFGETLAIWHGGIAIYGAILGGLIVLAWFCQRHHMSFLTMADLITPSMLLGQAIGRWGNFFNQEAFGPPTNLPWKIYIDPWHRPSQWFLESYFHPLFLYESFFSALGAVIALLLTKKLLPYKGSLLSFYLIWYGLGRLAIEQLRFDTATFGHFKVASILSLLIITLGILLFAKIILAKKN